MRKTMRKLPAALTMTETVVSLILIAIVFSVLIPQFRHIQSSWASRYSSLETVQNGRVLTEFMNRQLASAVKILAVSDPSDTRGFIEFQANDGKTCRFTLSDHGYVQFGEPAGLFDLAGPVSKLQFLCYRLDDLDTPVADVESVRFVKAVATVGDSSNATRSQEYVSSAFLYSSTVAESGYLYWTDDRGSSIERADLGELNIEAVVEGLRKPAALAVDVDGARVYWADNQTMQIACADLDGSNRTVLASGSKEMVGLSLDLRRGRIYWADDHEAKIRRANLDGSDTEDVVTDIGRVENNENLRIDGINGRIYWAQNRSGKTSPCIRRANLDGSDVRDIVAGTGRVTALVIDTTAGKMYWADKNDRVIRRANLDGSDIRTLVTNVYELTAMELDLAAGKMYWADGVNRSIQRSNLDGSIVENLVFAVDEPVSLVIDAQAGKMYWADKRKRRIQRANLDGSGIEMIASSAGQPDMLRLVGNGGPIQP